MTLTLKNSYTVKPAEPTANIKLCLSESDQIKSIKHTPSIYFYRRPTTDNCSFASAIETLKTSLSQALVHFYPLAGRLHWTNDGHRLELDCNSTGATLHQVESDAEVDDYGDFRPTPKLRKLIPFVDYDMPIHEMPLLVVQLTKFRCGGMSLGLGISHVVADGTASGHFIAEWAKIARGNDPLGGISPPYIDRTTVWRRQKKLQAMMPPKFDHSEYSPLPLLIGKLDDKEEREKESDVALLKLTKKEVERINIHANDDANYNNSDRPYSRYEAVSGHIWRCACKARNLDKKQLTNLRVAIDCRKRLNPPLPQAYFGNAVFHTMATSHAGELMDKPLGYASSRVREAAEKMTDEYIRSSIDFLSAQQDLSKFKEGGTKGCFLGNPNLSVTSWIGLPIHGANFGWGNEIYMGSGAIVSDGKCYILSGHDGDGSLVVILGLQVEHLGSFKKFFYEDIDSRN